MHCFAFNLEWVGGILAPGNTLCEGAGRQIRIPAEEDKVYDWRLIRRGGWRDAITPAEISASSSLAVIQPGQRGKGSRAINYNASCSPRMLRRHPPAPGGAQHWVRGGGAVSLSEKSDELQVQTLSQGRICIQNYRGKRWSQKALFQHLLAV